MCQMASNLSSKRKCAMPDQVLKDTIALLGIKTPLTESFGLMGVIRKGLPTKSLDKLAKQLELSSSAIVVELGLAKRTYARKVEKQELLSTEQTERVVRLARVFAYAKQVFGAEEKARRWMLKKNRALGGEVPLRLLDTDIGGNAVVDELGRIDYGVFA